MKNQIIAMMSSMNEEELTKIYQFVVEMMQTKQDVRYFDETTNYIKYRSLCSVPRDFLGVGIQSPSSQEYIRNTNEYKNMLRKNRHHKQHL